MWSVVFANMVSELKAYRQSKLSPSQLDELQKATHFDKKELQQWYKGMIDLFESAKYQDIG